MTRAPTIVVNMAEPQGAEAISLQRSALSEGLLLYEDLVQRPRRRPDEVGRAGWFFVARLGDRAVGCVEVLPLGTRAGEVRRTFVVRWARRRGVGGRLLTAAEKTARASGLLAVRTEVGRHEAAVTAFYESLGYHRVTRYGLRGVDPTNICLAKLLLPR